MLREIAERRKRLDKPGLMTRSINQSIIKQRIQTEREMRLIQQKLINLEARYQF